MHMVNLFISLLYELLECEFSLNLALFDKEIKPLQVIISSPSISTEL